MQRVAIPNRLQGAAIDDIRQQYGYLAPAVWRVWLHTVDHVHGTYLVLHPTGKVERVTVRQDEGDEVVVIKPEGD